MLRFRIQFSVLATSRLAQTLALVCAEWKRQAILLLSLQVLLSSRLVSCSWLCSLHYL